MMQTGGYTRKEFIAATGVDPLAAQGNAQNQASNYASLSQARTSNSMNWSYPYYYPQYYAVPLAPQYTLALAILAGKCSPALKKRAEAILAEGLK